MRTTRIISLFFLLALPMGMFAQTKSNVIKTNLFSPIVKTYWLSYERLLNEDMGVQLGAFYTGAKAGDTKLDGFGLNPEFRYYLSNAAAPKGIYIAPRLRYTNFTLKVTDDNVDAKGTYSAFGGGLLVGAQAHLKDLITLEFYIGPMYMGGSLNVKEGDEDDFNIGQFDGFTINGGVTIGVSF